MGEVVNLAEVQDKAFAVGSGKIEGNGVSRGSREILHSVYGAELQRAEARKSDAFGRTLACGEGYLPRRSGEVCSHSGTGDCDRLR